MPKVRIFAGRVGGNYGVDLRKAYEDITIDDVSSIVILMEDGVEMNTTRVKDASLPPKAIFTPSNQDLVSFI